MSHIRAGLKQGSPKSGVGGAQGCSPTQACPNLETQPQSREVIRFAAVSADKPRGCGVRGQIGSLSSWSLPILTLDRLRQEMGKDLGFGPRLPGAF